MDPSVILSTRLKWWRSLKIREHPISLVSPVATKVYSTYGVFGVRKVLCSGEGLAGAEYLVVHKLDVRL